MTKLVTTTLVILGTIIISKGQNNSYGLSFGIGNGIILEESTEGGYIYELNTGFSFGFQYNRKLTNKLQLMTSINWYSNSVTLTPNFDPNINITTKEYDVYMVYIPLLLRVDLGKYFFFNGGVLGSVDITKTKHISNQSGIGASIGIGSDFLIYKNLYFQFNPYINFHRLISTSDENYPERIFDTGIKLTLLLKK